MLTHDTTENATQLYSFSCIAKKYMGIDTLVLRNSAVLDFHNISVTAVSMALREAFDSGRLAQMGADHSSISFPQVSEDVVNGVLNDVGCHHLGLDTLHSDRSDGIEFHRFNVENILNALRASYQYGIQSVMDATDKPISTHTGLKP